DARAPPDLHDEVLVRPLLPVPFLRHVSALVGALELESTLAGGVGEGLDPAVVAVVTAVERGLRDSLRLRGLGELLPDRGRRLDVAAVVGLALGCLDRRAGRGHRDTIEIVNELGVYVLRRPEHAEPWALSGAGDLAPHPVGSAFLSAML